MSPGHLSPRHLESTCPSCHGDELKAQGSLPSPEKQSENSLLHGAVVSGITPISISSVPSPLLQRRLKRFVYVIICYSNTLACRETSLTKSSCAGERCFFSQALITVPSWRFLSHQPASWAVCVHEPVEPAGLVSSTLKMTNPRAGDLLRSAAVARRVLIAARPHCCLPPPRGFFFEE